MRTPEAKAGKAAGSLICSRTALGEASIVRASSSQPGSVRRSPSYRLLTTGKKMISAAIATLDAMP
jgi:hypothetical protein